MRCVPRSAWLLVLALAGCTRLAPSAGAGDQALVSAGGAMASRRASVIVAAGQASSVGVMRSARYTLRAGLVEAVR